MIDLSKFQVLPVEWMAGPKSSLFPTGPHRWRLLEQKRCFPMPSLNHKLMQDVCLFLRYFLHIREPFLRPYIWERGKRSNEWKLSAHTHQEHTPTSEPTLCLLIAGTYHLESNPNFSHCLQNPLRSGPWIPFFIHYSSKLDFPQIVHYSKLVPVLELLHFLFTIAVSIPSARMFRPLTFPWLVSAQMSTFQRSLLHLSHQSVISHCLKLSNSFFCILVSFPH